MLQTTKPYRNDQTIKYLLIVSAVVYKYIRQNCWCFFKKHQQFVSRMMMKILKCYFLLFISLSPSVLAQSLAGPISPCISCEQLSARTEPYNGTWYNPEQSGTGFSIDVQEGTVFGAYYGYDEQGKQIWLTFVGDLVPSNEVNVMWTVDADLLQFENGNAFNDVYKPPTQTEYQGQIHVKFTQKNHALFSVNNGDEQNIIPIIFGTSASADFDEQTSFLLPDLDGVWSFVYKLNSEVFPNYPKQWAYASNNFRITNKLISNRDGKYQVYYDVANYGPPPEILLFASINCEVIEQSFPECTYTDRQGFFGGVGEIPPEFHFSLGGLGAYSLFGETFDGHTFEAIKIDSTDYQSKQMQQSSSTQVIKFSDLDGPTSPCITCTQINETTEPFNGIWYNPEQSGSGFSLDVQNGKAFGAYYGYDEQGKQIWLTFVGDLIPSGDSNVMWTLDTDLLQFENGNSFNAAYQNPTITDYSGTIHIQFTQKNHAIFSVNGGDSQNIVPIIFGTSATADFANYSSYLLPELAGMWSITYHINWLIPGPYSSFPNQWGFLPRMFEIGHKTIHDTVGEYWVNYDMTAYTLYPDSVAVGQIRCEVVSDDLGNDAPECVFTDNFGILGYTGEPTPEFHFSLGGLGAYRLFGATLDGHTFEAIKIDSTDYSKK